MAEVLHGNAVSNQISVSADKTQVYGLGGGDTLTSDGKGNVLLVGGSGNGTLIMSGGNGTLSGGRGNDTFVLNYSATQTLSAVIEDVEPSNDTITVNFDGTVMPALTGVVSGNDLVLRDGNGLLNVTLKGVRENDYFDGTASDAAWDVLKLTNAERENQNLSPLTMSDGLTAGASVRAQEITTLFDHTRPDGTDCFTVLEKSYSAYGENIAEGQNSAASVVSSWMNSTGHRANILNSDYQKLGVGYFYENSLEYEHYWVQLFASTLTSPETVSTAQLRTANITVNTVGADSKVVTLSNGGATHSNTVEGATIIGGTGNDSIANSGASVSINGAAGNDYLYNTGVRVSISGGDGSDTIRNNEASVTITGNAGNDSIDSHGHHALIEGGGGNDTLLSSVGDWSGSDSSYPTLSGNDGNDYIDNRSSNASINGGEGSDTIRTYGTINGGTGNDSITNGGTNATIDGGAGSDSIINGEGEYAYNTTIIGGEGNDSINLVFSFNSLIQYALGGGDDTVEGFNEE